MTRSDSSPKDGVQNTSVSSNHFRVVYTVNVVILWLVTVDSCSPQVTQKYIYIFSPYNVNYSVQQRSNTMRNHLLLI